MHGVQSLHVPHVGVVRQSVAVSGVGVGVGSGVGVGVGTLGTNPKLIVVML
jgi:hypothetical protein